MISRLKGLIRYRGDGFIILDVGDIGYKIEVSADAVARLPSQAELFTHEVVREDGRELFGFISMDALELFWQLIHVSGVGPRTAQRIVNAGEAASVRAKIGAGDLAFLASISGIGKKTAQKILLELKGALVADTDMPSVDDDALAALIGLGYPSAQARDVLAMVDGETSEERVTRALKRLGKV